MRIIAICVITLTAVSASTCQNEPSQEILQKIEFDYRAVDDNGLINGEVALDYEFCIPKDDKKVQEIRSIVPDVLMPRRAKGRIKCSEEEWLCIVTTNDNTWKDKLYRLASLNYVKRIIPTHYE